MNIWNKTSFLTLIAICGFITIFRMSHTTRNELSWDILGYYLYLPATFIYDDPFLDDITWLEKLNDEKHLTGTLYMVSTDDKGNKIYFFLMGMAVFYLPFFLIANVSAPILGYPADGFSSPYQLILILGCIIYTIIGLIFFRKNLRNFFSDKLTALIMILIVFGTNYIHHLTVKNLEPLTILFMLVNIVVWHTIKWHENLRFKHLAFIGAGVTLITLVKPSEVFLVIIPLLWNVDSWKAFREKMVLFIGKWKQLLVIAGICLIIALPQLLYWHRETGKFFYDSYVNPGVGLDFFSAHILKVLFSYRKGWLLYTPIMIFPLIGFVFLYRENRKIFYSILIYFLLSFWLISSWTEWWYGASYSIRPLVTLYPVLSVPFGYLLIYLGTRKRYIQIGAGILFLFFIFLNQFQWWQLRNYILDPYRTTREYYWATFLKTKVDSQTKKLLSVYRDFSGKYEFSNPEDYTGSTLKEVNFEGEKAGQIISDTTGNSFFRFSRDQYFRMIFEKRYKEISKDDHFWIRARIDARFPDNFEGPYPCLVITMNRREGVYAYLAKDLRPEPENSGWNTFRSDYLTPEIRNRSDYFQCYVWKRGEKGFDIDNIKLEIFIEKKK